MSVTQQIRDYLSDHPEGLTPIDALDKFGCFRLSGRIYDIKNGVGCDPLDILTETETRGGKSYARYKKAERQPSFL